MLTSLFKLEDNFLKTVRLMLSAVILFYLITILSYSYAPLPLILNIDMNNIHMLRYAAGVTERQEPMDERKNNLSLISLVQQGSPTSTAPITIVDFSDFQCYLCARYVKAT